MVLEYANMEYYAKFNETEAKLLTAVTDSDVEELPDTLLSAQEEGTILGSELASLEDVKVVILKEEINLIVSGKIKYYSNGTLVDKNEIQTSAEGTVVVY